MKQKFDVFTWEEVQINEKTEARKGRLRLRISQPVPVYIEAQGFEVLAGYASDFDLEISEAVTFRVEAPEGVRAFRYAPFPTSTVADGEVFTNIDRMPHESGMLAEVTRARRMLEIEKRQMLAEIRREMAITRNVARSIATPEAEVQAEAEAEVPAEQEVQA